jgi:hypothetical protein
MHPLTTASDQRSDTTTGNVSGNAAEIDLGEVRSKVDVFVDVSGAATLTVEVSTDGSTWRPADTNDYASARTDLRQYDLAYQHVRAYADTNTNIVEVVGRGL